MGDSTDLESALVISELKEWLDSSLCGCVVGKVDNGNLEEKQSSERGGSGTESPSQMNAAILDQMLTNGKIFQWLLHSFKPEIM